MQGLKSDVSIQRKVLDLPADIKAKPQLSLLFVTHGLRVALQICDRIAVMRHGAIVELAPTAEIFARPQHPYTKALFDAVPGAARSQSPAAAQEEIPWTSRRTASCPVGASPCRARRTGRSPG
jgi:oligopeptide/dipeptide ABC transporter ATP-binding protein